MKAKIDQNIICIPPYVSTTWDQVAFVQTAEDSESGAAVLELHTVEGSVISIPNLDNSLIDVVFSAHLRHLEERGSRAKSEPRGGLFQLLGLKPDQLSQMPIQFGIAGIPGVENIESIMQHNQAQSNAEDLPTDILEKFSTISKMLTGGDASLFPKPEPHCNCVHCQIARVVHDMEKEEGQEEEISDEELSFRDWEIEEAGEHLYTVINPLDRNEHYTVYLGSPVGCTCGQSDCEHIKAVLRS